MGTPRSITIARRSGSFGFSVIGSAPVIVQSAEEHGAAWVGLYYFYHQSLPVLKRLFCELCSTCKKNFRILEINPLGKGKYSTSNKLSSPVLNRELSFEAQGDIGGSQAPQYCNNKKSEITANTGIYDIEIYNFL